MCLGLAGRGWSSWQDLYRRGRKGNKDIRSRSGHLEESSKPLEVWAHSGVQPGKLLSPKSSPLCSRTAMIFCVTETHRDGAEPLEHPPLRWGVAVGLGGQACCCSTGLAISDSPKACFSWVSAQTQVTRRLGAISLLNPFYWAICSELRCVLLLGVVIPLSRLLARHRLRPSQLLLPHTIKPSHLLTSGKSEMSAGPWASGPQLNGNPRGLVPCSAFFRS